jgi:hypothetical protein
MRFEYCPLDGRVYHCGGDFAGSRYGDSGRQENFSCDPKAPNVWRLDYPYEGYVGDVMPGGPDEVCWTWDSLRRVFWMVPGFMYGAHPGVPQKATALGGHVMTFNPVTRKWADIIATSVKPPVPAGTLDMSGLARTTHGFHIAATDEIHRFAWHGGYGMAVSILKCSTLTHTVVGLRGAGGDTFPYTDSAGVKRQNNDRLNAEYQAWNGEEMFAVSDNLGRCFGWNPVTRVGRMVCSGLPFGTTTSTSDGRSMLFWNPTIARLEFYFLEDLRGYIKSVWTIDPKTGEIRNLGNTFDGKPVYGNVGIHMPGIGTILMAGHLNSPADPSKFIDPPYISVVKMTAGGTPSDPPPTPPDTPPLPLPTVPANVTATKGAASDRVVVDWTDSLNETSYDIYRSTASGALGAFVASVADSIFVDTAVASGVTYYYSVAAVNASGVSGFSAQASGFVATADPVPGTSDPPTSPGPAGEWRVVPVNAHARVRPVYKNPAATDAALPVTGTVVFTRAFSHAVMGRDGLLYYHGGAHSDYPGNEVDVFDTGTQKWRAPKRPHVPPATDAMYAGGGTYSVWGDIRTSTWEPYSIHGYGRQSWLPGLGYAALIGITLADGTKAIALCTWNGTAWQYHGLPLPSNVTSQFNLSEYDDKLNGLLSMGGDGSSTTICEFSLATRTWKLRHRLAGNQFYGQMGTGGQHIVYLENGKHLILRMPSSGGPLPPALFVYDGIGMKNIPIPDGHVEDIGISGRLYAAVDRVKRRVFFAHPVAGNLRLWVAFFDNLSEWSAMGTTPAVPWTASGGQDRAPLHYFGGSLYLIAPYGGAGWTNGIVLRRLVV